MELKRNFLQAILDLDSDERIIAPGRLRDAVNIRVLSSEGGDAGSIENVLGNEKLTTLDLGANPETIGADRSEILNKIFWLVKSDTGSYFLEHDIKTGNTDIILKDTRVGTNNVLNLSKDHHVKRIVIIEDNDNEARLAIWTDGLNEIRCVNIDRAKTYGENVFDADAITLLKRPPATKPSISLANTPTELENNISEKFIRFAYSYKYLDGEYSPLSPFTEIAFEAKLFSYDFAINSNESMLNQFNKVILSLNTGNQLVTDIRVVFKESNQNVSYIIDVYNKADEQWVDDTDVTLEFSNNKISKVLAEDELFRISDNIPKKAKTLELIDNRLMISDYTENHNLIDVNDQPVVVDLELEHNTAPIADLIGVSSVKSLIDYEVGLEYIDEWDRPTSVITSANNNVFVPGIDSNKKNTLSLKINNLAPSFAKAYRVFIKQSKYSYDTLVPIVFYSDKQFVWIKLGSGEQDKINEGDYLVVKADTKGILSSYRETRVIEIVTKERNFLEITDVAETKQEPGLYFKIKPTGFQISEADFSLYEFKGYDNTSSGQTNPIRDEVNVIEPAVYYGDGILDDLTESGTYTGPDDVRYIIQIDASNTPDTFKWSDDDGNTFTNGVAITGSAQVLSNGLEVTFANTTGHSTTDQWIVSAKNRRANEFGKDEENFAYSIFKSLPSNGNINLDDAIEGGAKITLSYVEYIEGDLEIRKEFTSTRLYANLEEWWFGDNIAAQFNYPRPDRVYFRRGIVAKDDATHKFFQNPTGDMCLILKSIADENGLDNNVFAASTIKIEQIDFYALLETKSTSIKSEIFYEIGDTYPITAQGFHQGLVGDTNQTAEVAQAVINLNFFNCFAWGNGFESYKIKDSFNGTAMNIDTRPSTTIDDYRENYRKAGIVWGGRYEQTTNYNAINEFNRSLLNFIDLDDADGAINYLHNRGKTLVAFQENRITPLGYRKNFIYDQLGNETSIQSDDILTIPESYTGEYGMSNHPESFAFFGNRLYNVDVKRGSPIRLSTDGISEINPLTKDFFKDLFRAFPDARYEGGYDPYFDEYLLAVTIGDEKMTFGFAEVSASNRKAGWVGFYSFAPEKMVGISNRFYSFKNGQLYIHNSENVPRNNFYGTQYASKVAVIFNEAVGDDKIFKAISQEGSDSWNVTLETNLGRGYISKDSFEKRESNYYAYTRRNIDSLDLSGLNTQGLGEITSVTGNEIIFSQMLCSVNEGDILHQIANGNNEVVGVITSISDQTITIADFVNTPRPQSYSYIKKPASVEGANLRGYYMKAILENSSIQKTELFSVNTNAVKSYV